MITVYSTPTCHYCKEAKALLTEHGFEYEEVNVLADVKEREKMIELSGARTVPVIDFDGEILNGFEALQEYVIKRNMV